MTFMSRRGNLFHKAAKVSFKNQKSDSAVSDHMQTKLQIHKALHQACLILKC